MKIKAATKKDFDKVADMDVELCLYERRFDSMIKPGEAERRSVKEVKTWKNARAFIAKEDKDVIGFILGWTEKIPYYKAKRGFISDVFVEKEFRHKGIGESLIKNMVRWFKERNIKDVDLNVYSKNIKALKIYKHLGFKEFDKVMRLKI